MRYLKRPLLFLALTAVLLLPRTVSLAVTATGPSSGLTNPIAANSLSQFLTKFLDILVQVGFPIIVLAIIYTGFLFVKAQGNPEELQTAKRAFMWTVIGALILLGASAISELVQGTVDEIRR